MDRHYKKDIEVRGRNNHEHKGLYSDQVKNILNALLPHKSRVVPYKDKKTAERDIKDAISKGYLVPIAMHWEVDRETKKPGGHELAIENIDKEYVYIRNPRGDREKGGPEDISENLPPREVVSDGINSGGHIRLKKEDFYKRLMDYIIPEH